MATMSVTFTTKPSFSSRRLGLLPVAHDEAQDAELLGVGDGEGQDVELGLGQQLDRAAQGAGLVFQEQGELFYFHRWIVLRVTFCAGQ